MTRTKGDVKAMIRQYLKAGDCAVDVGAARGDMTKEMVKCVGPTGSVIAIEAEPTRGQELRERFREHSHVLVAITGVGETDGTMPLYRPESTSASRWHGDGTPPIEVPMTRLDELAQRADLVKIDAQGSESHILDGAQHLLDHCPIWILELWPYGLMTAGRSMFTLMAQLRAHGLTPHWYEGDVMTDKDLMAQLGTNPRQMKHVNIVAIR
jgi:FkbM family methyltransferase